MDVYHCRAYLYLLAVLGYTCNDIHKFAVITITSATHEHMKQHSNFSLGGGSFLCRRHNNNTVLVMICFVDRYNKAARVTIARGVGDCPCIGCSANGERLARRQTDSLVRNQIIIAVVNRRDGVLVNGTAKTNNIVQHNIIGTRDYWRVVVDDRDLCATYSVSWTVSWRMV